MRKNMKIFEKIFGENKNKSHQREYETKKSNRFERKEISEPEIEILHITIKPGNFEEAYKVTDAVMEKNVVTVDTGKMNERDKRRILDFIRGFCYAIGAKIIKVGEGVFIVLPKEATTNGKDLNEDVNSNF